MKGERPPAPEPLAGEVFDSHCHLDIMVGARAASSGDPIALAAQAAGDFEALKERGRRIARVRLEDVA